MDDVPVVVSVVNPPNTTSACGVVTCCVVVGMLSGVDSVVVSTGSVVVRSIGTDEVVGRSVVVVCPARKVVIILKTISV